MKLPKCLPISVFVFACAANLASQQLGRDVENLTLTEISPVTVRLSWTAFDSNHCGDKIAYSVYRGKTEDFNPSEENRIATGITSTYYIAHEPKGGEEFFYYVKADVIEGHCAPPSLKTGTMVVYPLDLGGQYEVTIGDKTEVCKASSTVDLACDTLPYFHAVVASQSGHEFLIGCLSSDFENNNWTCVNLTAGPYTIGVHSMTVTVWGTGFEKINTQNGKLLGPITPEFSILSILN